MKKAFTLVELLIVVVVIAILASVAFRLGGIGGESSRRTKTIVRMQRLENCISGYFAAYGSYPPVALQGRSRNYRCKVNKDTGVQQVEDNPDTGADLTSETGWRQVEAACRAQPVGIRFPFNKGWHSYVKRVSDSLVKKGKCEPFDALENLGRLTEKAGESDWTEVQLFQFGLLSYLLPRYLIMMGYGNDENGGTDSAASRQLYDDFKQWDAENSRPCRFKDGARYESWEAVNTAIAGEEKWTVAALPTQAVTARWLANLQGILDGGAKLNNCYGVTIGLGEPPFNDVEPPEYIYSSGDSQSGESGVTSGYVLDGITCQDGWLNDFYYYSLPPYQSYRLWSAGPNGKTFPPWVPDEEINELTGHDTIRNWLADDIVHLSN